MLNDFDDSKIDSFYDQDPTSFEMLFLNRSYKPDIDIKPQKSIVSVTKSFAKAFSSIAASSGGVDINLSGEIYEHTHRHNKQFSDLNFYESLGEQQVNWYYNFDGTKTRSDSFKYTCFRKAISTITAMDSTSDILNLLESQFQSFLMNLFYGSMESNQALLETFESTRKLYCLTTQTPFIYSLLAAISPRITMTGYLRKNKMEVELKQSDSIIVTADRNYFCLGSKKVIFVNCALILGMIKPNDYIHIDDITLRVKRQVKLSIECTVIQGGLLRPLRKVIFPCKITLSQVTIEELQDLSFCKESLIHTVVLPMPGCNAYYKSIRSAMEVLQYRNTQILVTVHQNMVCSKEYAKWIAETYDGIILIIDENPQSHVVVRFTEEVRVLMKLCYDLKRLIILTSFLPKICSEGETITLAPEDLKTFLFYPDASLIQPNELSRTHMEIIGRICVEIASTITNFAMEDLTGPFEDKSFTGSDSVARAVVHASYTTNADAIIVSTISGRMAEKIAHFRPKCSIIALIKNIYAVRYLNIIHNIFVAYYTDEKTKTRGTSIRERRELNRKKLLFAVIYGISKKILDAEATILYVYKRVSTAEFPFQVLQLKLDAATISTILSQMD